jgi:hypothetical protein
MVMGVNGLYAPASRELPYANRLVIRCRKEVLARRMEGKGTNPIIMTWL